MTTPSGRYSLARIRCGPVRPNPLAVARDILEEHAPPSRSVHRRRRRGRGRDPARDLVPTASRGVSKHDAAHDVAIVRTPLQARGLDAKDSAGNARSPVPTSRGDYAATKHGAQPDAHWYIACLPDALCGLMRILKAVSGRYAAARSCDPHNAHMVSCRQACRSTRNKFVAIDDFVTAPASHLLSAYLRLNAVLANLSTEATIGSVIVSR
jgi:hypothetical protein